MNQQALHVRDNRNEAVIDDQVVGMVVYKRDGNRLVIRHTMVEPGLRGDGVGTKPLELGFEFGGEAGDEISFGFVVAFFVIGEGRRHMAEGL